MQLQQEEDIRQYIEARLKQKGVSTEREVACGNGIRADLVTPNMVIEIKRQLNRGAIYQAYGQGVAYQKLLKKPKLLIIGLAPVSESKYQEAQRIAENIRTRDVEVVFIDKDPNWGIAAASVGGWLAGWLGKSASKPAKTQLPFEPAQASTTGVLAEKVAEKVVEKAAEKIAEQVEKAEKAAESSAPLTKSIPAKPAEVVLPPEPAKPPPPKPPAPPGHSTGHSTMKDFWILLLIILVFLVIRTYLWPSQSSRSKWADPPAGQVLPSPRF